MEIRAKCKFDMASMKALTHLIMFKKLDPKKRMILWSVAYLILSVIIILEMLAFGIDTVLVVLFCAEVIVILLIYYWYFIIPKNRYKALANMKDAENEYLFCDDLLMVSTKTAVFNGEAKIEYSLFVRVFETSKYFFLYQTNNQVYLVDKSTIENGTAEDIRNKLMDYVTTKYVICNY